MLAVPTCVASSRVPDARRETECLGDVVAQRGAALDRGPGRVAGEHGDPGRREDDVVGEGRHDRGEVGAVPTVVPVPAEVSTVAASRTAMASFEVLPTERAVNPVRRSTDPSRLRRRGCPRSTAPTTSGNGSAYTGGQGVRPGPGSMALAASSRRRSVRISIAGSRRVRFAATRRSIASGTRPASTRASASARAEAVASAAVGPGARSRPRRLGKRFPGRTGCSLPPAPDTDAAVGALIGGRTARR